MDRHHLAGALALTLLHLPAPGAEDIASLLQDIQAVKGQGVGSARARLVGNRFDDPEFGYDAIQVVLAELDRKPQRPRDQVVAALQRAFRATRDLAQSRDVATRLRPLGVEVSVADHLGFLRDWYVLGPLDAHGGKGFHTIYPPERRVDLQAELEGKNGKKLHWQRFTVPETAAG